MGDMSSINLLLLTIEEGIIYGERKVKGWDVGAA